MRNLHPPKYWRGRPTYAPVVFAYLYMSVCDAVVISKHEIGIAVLEPFHDAFAMLPMILAKTLLRVAECTIHSADGERNILRTEIARPLESVAPGLHEKRGSTTGQMQGTSQCPRRGCGERPSFPQARRIPGQKRGGGYGIRRHVPPDPASSSKSSSSGSSSPYLRQKRETSGRSPPPPSPLGGCRLSSFSQAGASGESRKSFFPTPDSLEVFIIPLRPVPQLRLDPKTAEGVRARDL